MKTQKQWNFRSECIEEHIIDQRGKHCCELEDMKSTITNHVKLADGSEKTILEADILQVRFPLEQDGEDEDRLKIDCEDDGYQILFCMDHKSKMVMALGLQMKAIIVAESSFPDYSRKTHGTKEQTR